MALACGGSAFSSDENNNGGTNGEGASSGTLNRAGNSTGGTVGKGGTKSGGTSAGGTDTGGTDTGGTDTGGTDTGGTDTGGTNSGGGASGGITSGGSGMTGGNPNAGSGGGTSIDIVCPKNQPSAGHACKDGLVCSYGTDIRTTCRNIAKCSGGLWAVDKPNCESLNACEPGTMAGLMCDENISKPCALSKQYCLCSACTGGACMVDGAIWQCSGAPLAGCPELAPNEGQACTGARQCTYGGCNVGWGVTASCGGDAVWSWSQLNNMCPL